MIYIIIIDLLNKLVELKDQLVENLNNKNIDASNDETLNTLIPKVLDIKSEENKNIEFIDEIPEEFAWETMIKKIIIPEGIITIGTGQVKYNNATVILPSTVTTWNTASSNVINQVCVNSVITSWSDSIPIDKIHDIDDVTGICKTCGRQLKNKISLISSDVNDSYGYEWFASGSYTDSVKSNAITYYNKSYDTLTIKFNLIVYTNSVKFPILYSTIKNTSGYYGSITYKIINSESGSTIYSGSKSNTTASIDTYTNLSKGNYIIEISGRVTKSGLTLCSFSLPILL